METHLEKQPIRKELDLPECSERIAGHSSERVNELSEKYQIFDELGHGAQGKIFSAIRKSDGQYVAIKQLNISSVKTWKEYELFQREAKVLESLKVPGVAKFYEAVECLEDNPPCSYIVQEYIPGTTLQTMLNAGHRFKMDDIYDIIIQTLEILDRLHHHDPPVIHRDIKPSNIMLSLARNHHYKVTIIDFGAVANPQIQGGGSTVAGTYGYMPPEQLTGKPCPASDVYALAAVAVQLFSGKSPADMPTKDFRLIFEPDMQDKPHELVTTLRRMLDPDVDERLADIPAIIDIFRHYRRQKYQFKTDGNRHDSNDADCVYDAECEEKLNKIEHIGEAGNIELWQKLSDSTPRQFPTTLLDNLNAPEMDDETMMRSESGSPAKDLMLVMFWFVLLFSLFLLFFTHRLALSLMILIIGEGIVGILTLFVLCFRKKNNTPQNDNTKYESEITQILELARNGRKAIATITKIEYIPSDSKNIQILVDKIEDVTNREKFKNRAQLLCYARPKFSIHYKFNPPDDVRKEDIIHKFVTFGEPDGHYQIGDPIPILYLIEDMYFGDKVMSMPYPLPFLDNRRITDIVDDSLGEFETNHLDFTAITNQDVEVKLPLNIES